MTQITDAEIQRRLKTAETFTPPLEMADQHALLFAYRSLLHICLILMERGSQKDEQIKRLRKGNADLTRMLEEWIIKHPVKGGGVDRERVFSVHNPKPKV